MTATSRDLVEDYTAAIWNYLDGGGEAALRRGYELGRRALAEGWGVLEMTATHQKCMEALTGERGAPITESARTQALNFLAESLSPFEMVLRGYQETNARLRQSLKDLMLVRDQLRRQNEVLAAAHRAVEAERQRYRELFDVAPDAYLVTDLEGRIREANSAATKLLQTPQPALAGKSLVEFLSEDEQETFRARLRELPTSGLEKAEEWQTSVRLNEGAIPVALTVGAERTSAGVLSGLRWLFRDVTAQRRAEEERTRSQVGRAEAEAARRFRFLAEASSLLVSSLNYEASLSRVARLAVSYLADWCFVHVFEPDGSMRQLVAAYGQSAGPLSAAELRRLTGGAVRERAGLLAQVKEAQIFDEIDDHWLEEFANRAEDVESLRALDLRCAIIVPFLTYERALGTLSLALSDPHRRYGRNDLVLAEDLARRCALALENARLYREVIEEWERAESASRAKDEFLAVLSHELRNPLTPVLGWARIFKGHSQITQDATLSEGAQALERNAEHLARLVNDCLDLVRISQGNIQVEKKPVDLNQVILTSAEAVRETALGKRLEFVVELAEQPLRVLGDAVRLQQVFLNLLTNAIKYTESGGQALVRASLAGLDAEIEVKDTGIGIEERFLEQIFQPFRQGGSRWLTSESGLGLGLAIARRIVAMHDGRIWAESKGIGCGSTFRVRLPLSTATGRERSPGLVEADETAVRALRVLFIEDAKDILFLMKVELEMRGYAVLTADNAVKGLEIALQERPDVIISDLKMPGLDGCELIRKIRQTGELAETPAIALTGLGARADIERALAAGFNACLSKPAETQELCALIRRFTDR